LKIFVLIFYLNGWNKMMLFNWLKPKTPLLEEPAADWLQQTFNWCLNQFDADFFYRHSELVIPSNRYFPGRANSPHEMAELIFAKVQHYAGMSHWSCQVLPPDACPAPVQLQTVKPLRGRDIMPVASTSAAMPVQYDPRQVNNPEAMIATFAHALAYYLSIAATHPPPGDEESIPYATEVLAIFMGFGLMFANSAFTFQGGCGSCRTVGRAAYLSEYESTYALAIFCVLKKIAPADVTRYLKKHLRGFFKRATKELERTLTPTDSAVLTAR
jgi:hypothetical protein